MLSPGVAPSWALSLVLDSVKSNKVLDCLPYSNSCTTPGSLSTAGGALKVAGGPKIQDLILGDVTFPYLSTKSLSSVAYLKISPAS